MAPELLELEITESMVMHNTDRAVALLNAIKELGVVAIDDFVPDIRRSRNSSASRSTRSR
jgi:predicted signal transduction protein with EAL and GGDEF domain